MYKFIRCFHLWKASSIRNICIFNRWIELLIIINNIFNKRMLFSTDQTNAVVDLFNCRYHIDIGVITFDTCKQIFSTAITNMCCLIVSLDRFLQMHQ